MKRLTVALVSLVLGSLPQIVAAQSFTPCGNGDPNCLTTAGPVGIGTSTPAANTKLEVFGGFVQLTMPVGSTGSAVVWFSQKNVASNQGTWALASRNAGHFAFYNQGVNADVMNLLPNGNVGIGTQTPGQALELVRNNADSAVRFHNPGQYWYTVGINNAAGGLFAINRGPSPGFVPDLTINGASGNVGIGTATAPDTLTVAGSVTVGPIRVINSSGQWVGSPTGLVGPQGPMGPAGSAGPPVTTFCVAGFNSNYFTGAEKCAVACGGAQWVQGSALAPCSLTSDTGPCNSNSPAGSNFCCVCKPR